MNDKNIWKTAAEFNKFITVQVHTTQGMKFVVCAINTSPNYKNKFSGYLSFIMQQSHLSQRQMTKNNNTALLFSAYM